MREMPILGISNMGIILTDFFHKTKKWRKKRNLTNCFLIHTLLFLRTLV